MMTNRSNGSRAPAILMASHDHRFVHAVSEALNGVAHVRAVPDGFSLITEIQAGDCDLILLEMNLPDDCDGLATLRRIHEQGTSIPVHIVAPPERPEIALQAGQLGASGYHSKSASLEILVTKIRASLKSWKIERERKAVEIEQKQAERLFVGESDEVLRLLEDAEMVARVGSTVLVTGENGTGKEVLSRLIHARSHRAERLFVAVNCAAIPEGLVESKLFGHERGAFTGATSTRRGGFEVADGGTLFLDEITEMPIGLQPKLLRALQSGEFSRVGSERVQRADARMICSSNRKLDQAVEQGQLRQDLFYRINVVRLHIPPLRERRQDILALARHFLRKKAKELGKRIERLTREAESILMAHDWPGNARELENAIERAVVFCASAEIGPELLAPISAGAPYLLMPWEQARDQALRRFERNYLTALLQAHRGTVSSASRAMGVSRQALYKALERTGLNAETFRQSGGGRIKR